MPTGRPCNITPEIGEQLLEEIICTSKGLRSICKKLGVSMMSVMRKLRSDPAFRDQYGIAKQEQAEMMVEDILEIADDTSNDDIETEHGAIANGEWIARSRLRVDSRKWIASKLKAKKYGDKIGVEHSGEMHTTVTAITEERLSELREKKRKAMRSDRQPAPQPALNGNGKNGHN